MEIMIVIKCEGGIVIKSSEERNFIEIEPDMKEIRIKSYNNSYICYNPKKKNIFKWKYHWLSDFGKYFITAGEEEPRYLAWEALSYFDWFQEISKEEAIKRAEYAYSYAVAEKPDENTSGWFVS